MPLFSAKPVLDGEIFSLNPSKLAQLLPERVHEDRATGSSAWIEETYAEDFPWLLRVGEPLSAKSKAPSARPKIFFLMSFPFSVLRLPALCPLLHAI